MSGHTQLCYATNGGFLYECHCDEPPPMPAPSDEEVEA
jgi:hypothetical protein